MSVVVDVRDSQSEYRVVLIGVRQQLEVVESILSHISEHSSESDSTGDDDVDGELVLRHLLQRNFARGV